ncbi:MAG: helix-turn-helix transcriptional regulator [Clostridia bacterium]|nr:helix-turn-helix transcriptional regulator [Clostridia bacterium]
MLNLQIKKLRLANGITQVELAKHLGVTKQCVSNWENDNIQPSVDMLIKLSSFFKVSTDYMLGIEEREFIDATGLTEDQIAHIRYIIEDIVNK